MFFTYILFSTAYDKYYIGQTNDLEDRLYRHNAGSNKSTAPYRPWKIVCTIPKETRAEAVVLENKLKNLTKERLRHFIQKYSNSK